MRLGLDHRGSCARHRNFVILEVDLLDTFHLKFQVVVCASQNMIDLIENGGLNVDKWRKKPELVNFAMAHRQCRN